MVELWWISLCLLISKFLMVNTIKVVIQLFLEAFKCFYGKILINHFRTVYLARCILFDGKKIIDCINTFGVDTVIKICVVLTA